MNIKKTLFTTGLLTIATLSVAMPAQAGVSCQPIYGGGQTCVTTGNLLISKQVLNPKTNQMVETLDFNDPRYKPEDIVLFKIVLTNSGGTALQNIQVQDTLPSYLSFSGGAGNYDQNTKRLTYTVANLNPNESNSVSFQARIVSGNLPSDQQVTCQNNVAFATVGSNTQQDNAGFCVEKPVAGQPVQQVQPGQPVAQPQQPTVTKGGKVIFPAPTAMKTTPPTGPEALSLLAMVPTGLLGYILRKKAVL